MAKPRTSGLYSVHPGLAMVQKWITDLPAKTGRSLEEWIEFVKKQGPAGEKERRAWLKAEHKLGTNSASWIAERAEGKGSEEDSPEAYLHAAEEWVEAMYSGAKKDLRPIHDALLKLGLRIGKDVKACPGKTAVPFYRNHVFAQIKPTTNTRVDLGLALGRTKAPMRLIDTGGYEKKDRITHRIPISKVSDIDDDVKGWLKKAYEMDA
jgi:Domain of unknown function (DUF5655)/Domain of unknown function (DUF4287)